MSSHDFYDNYWGIDAVEATASSLSFGKYTEESVCNKRKRLGIRTLLVYKKEEVFHQTIAKYIKERGIYPIKDLNYCIDTFEKNALEPHEFIRIGRRVRFFIHDLLESALCFAYERRRGSEEVGYSAVDLSKFTRTSRLSKIKELKLFATDKQNKFFKWPSRGQFKPDMIPSLIRDYVNVWRLDYMFKFSVKVIEKYKNDYCHYYRIRVLFSAPTPNCPNPQATASVYFNIEVNFVVPETVPIHVTYVFEGFDFIHDAKRNQFNFQQGIIKVILTSKIKLYSALDF